MNVGTTLSVRTRAQWRSWLTKHHATKKEIWFIFHKKGSGIKGVSYNEAVEEALCFGWIDSIVKTRDEQSYVQRFSPRKPSSVLSEMNKERIRRLIASKKMRAAGLNSISRHLHAATRRPAPFVFPADILAALRKDPVVWKHYRSFPLSYRRIRIGWIDGARSRPAEFRRRLSHFLRQTAKNKRFGMVQ